MRPRKPVRVVKFSRFLPKVLQAETAEEVTCQSAVYPAAPGMLGVVQGILFGDAAALELVKLL